MVDHKDHRSVGSLIAVDSAEMQASLVEAFTAAGLPAPKQAETGEQLRQSLAADTLDLIVMSSNLGGSYVAPMISEIRRGTLGPHPFPIVVVLIEERDPAALRQVSNCGPDDIIRLPCKPADLLERIDVFLAGGRQPLVVTAGYAGPERRKLDRQD